MLLYLRSKKHIIRNIKHIISVLDLWPIIKAYLSSSIFFSFSAIRIYNKLLESLGLIGLLGLLELLGLFDLLEI